MRNLLAVAVAVAAMFSCGEGYNATMFLEEGYSASENDAVDEDSTAGIDTQEADLEFVADEVDEDIVPEVDNTDTQSEVEETVEPPKLSPNFSVEIGLLGYSYTADLYLVFIPLYHPTDPYPLLDIPCTNDTIKTGCAIAAHLHSQWCSTEVCPEADPWGTPAQKFCCTDPVPETQPNVSSLGKDMILKVEIPKPERLKWTITKGLPGHYLTMIDIRPIMPSWLPAVSAYNTISAIQVSTMCGSDVLPLPQLDMDIPWEGVVHTELFWEGLDVKLPSCEVAPYNAGYKTGGTLYTWNAELGNWQKIN